MQRVRQIARQILAEREAAGVSAPAQPATEEKAAAPEAGSACQLLACQSPFEKDADGDHLCHLVRCGQDGKAQGLGFICPKCFEERGDVVFEWGTEWIE